MYATPRVEVHLSKCAAIEAGMGGYLAIYLFFAEYELMYSLPIVNRQFKHATIFQNASSNYF